MSAFSRLVKCDIVIVYRCKSIVKYIYIYAHIGSLLFEFLHFSCLELHFKLASPGSLRQLYLGVLWLYTRESWLPHVLDAVAGRRH